MPWNRTASGLRVAVLAGGDSAERNVSLASGAQVLAALRRVGHQAQSFDPVAVDLDDIAWSEFDACFIALHGGAGEDGRVQQRLERLGVPYTGSGPAASRLAMSKSASKERFFLAGVPTQPYVLLHESDPPADAARKAPCLGFPVVVKPDGQGSSLGLGFADSPGELARAFSAARHYDSFVLVEPWIDGREFTVAVLGRHALPLLEIATPRGLFDYQAKYSDDATQCRVDTGLAEPIAARLEQVAVAATAALGTTGLSRVDLMLDRADRPWVLEVNTVPGLTDHSLAPRAAAWAGLDLHALCDWMVRDCLALEVVP